MANAIKAFNLQLLVGRENIMGSKHKISIESIDSRDKNLYIGTSDGTIYHFLILEDVVESSGRVEPKFNSFLQAQTRISSKKAIVQIKASIALKCLLVNTDGLIQGYSMLDLSPSFAMLSRVKNVNRFYINQHPVHSDPFSIEMYVTFLKKKNIQLYQVQEDNVVPLRDFSFHETPLSVAVDAHFMCVGGSTSYFIYDTSSNKRQDLIPVESGSAFVHRVASGEFLLAAPNSLGVFVTSAGISQRAPIQWAPDVSQACFVHPYVVALDNQHVTVHSVLDQETKQHWPFQGGVSIVKDSNSVLLCTGKDVFILSLTPFSEQVSKLIEQGSVEEGLELAKECAKVMRRGPMRELLQMTFRKAGFQYMKQFNFDKADEMLVKGEIDVREIISLYPNALPVGTAYISHSPPYHKMKSVYDFSADSPKYIEKCYLFLSQYLQNHILTTLMKSNATEYSKNHTDDSYVNDVLMSSIAVFAKLHQTTNLQYIFHGSDSNSAIAECATSPHFSLFRSNFASILKLLNTSECYHASADFKILLGDVDGAMEEWKELVLGEKSDKDFPGPNFVADLLSRHYAKTDILWKHAEWMLQYNEDIGITVFTSRVCVQQEDVDTKDLSSVFPKADEIIDFLHPFKDSVLHYLEHLVFVCQVQKEKYHTHLAVLYLEIVLKSSDKKNDEHADLRKKFQRLLKESNLYRISLILGKVQDSHLFQEHVILCGKQGEHKKALEILVNKMKNPVEAESYCLDQSDDFERRKDLFKALLKVYLNKITASSTANSKYVIAVADLLNRQSEFYNPLDVMHLLSNDWSMQLLHQFLSGTMLANIHTRWTSNVEKMLACGRLKAVNNDLAVALQKRVVLTEDTLCSSCDSTFQDPECVVYPNLVAVHPKCGKNKHVCPVTGKLFKVEEKSVDRSESN